MINYWLCWKGSRASVLKGGFETLDKAIKFYGNQIRKSRMEIRNKDRSKVVWPEPTN